MFDLWYAVGTGIMFPELVDEGLVTGANGCFANVPQHVGPKDTAAPLPSWLPAGGGAYDLPAGGYVNEATISAFRQSLAAGIKRTVTRADDFPPALSLHAAATISQWISVPTFDYKNKLEKSNAAFKALSSVDRGSYSTGFRALLGVLFIDPKLPALFTDSTQEQAADAIASEFNVKAQQRGVLNSFANALQPAAVASAARVGGNLSIRSQVSGVSVPALIDRADAGDWQQCSHTFLVWEGHSTGMLN